MRFRGKAVVVTGAAAGLGREAAAAFLAEGARVALLDLDQERARAVAAELAEAGAGEALGVGCDVADAGSVERAFVTVAAELGAVEVLVNNAGVSSSARFAELAESDWDAVMDTNAKGTFLCSRAVVPAMLERGSGAIVNVSSQAAKNGQPLIAHYCASKAAVIGLTRALALELAPAVRVNAVCPGVVDTEMVRGTIARQARMVGREPEEMLAEIVAGIPLGRPQSPAAVAEAIAYLAAAGEVTGQALNVSGGMVVD